MTDALRTLAGELGVEPGYWDVRGAWHEPSVEALVALVSVLGSPIAAPDQADDALAELRDRRGRRLVEPVLLVAEGRPLHVELPAPVREAALHLESGAEAPVVVRPGSSEVTATDLPVGYHRLEVAAGTATAAATVVVHPHRVRSVPRDRRDWGVFAPLHGVGPDPTYGDLGRLGDWVASLGGAVVGTLPLLATFPWDPSPYAPISRSVWASRYVDRGGVVDAEPGPAGGADALTTWGLRGPGWEALEAWVAAHPRAVDVARFRARAAVAGGGWHHPRFDASLDDVTLGRAGGAVRLLVDQHLAARQLAEVAAGFRARGQRLYLDLPLGAHPDGWDTYEAPGLYAFGASAGAPPDDFFSGGQDWGFPPVLPEAARADGHRQLRHDLAHHMAVAGMLRIDHVMQLHRLFWIPSGFDGAHGAYVRAPREELFAVLAVESSRHDCWVVGEDLGTVPDEVRAALDDHDVCGMWVAEFSMDPWPGAELRLPGPRSVASVDTHDTPTLAGWRRGRDLELLDELGLLDHDVAAPARGERVQQDENLVGWLAARGHLADGERADEAVHAALLEAVGETDAEVVLVTLEDLWGETEPQNVPGTPSDRPNWVQQLRVPLSELPGFEPGVAALARLDRARAGDRGTDGSGHVGA